MAMMDLPQGVILVIGSLNMDRIFVVPSHATANGHVSSMSDIQTPGGHGANQAVACMRLSHYKMEINNERRNSYAELRPHDIDVKVFMKGIIGSRKSNNFGVKIRRALRDNGVNDYLLEATEEEGTGEAFITINEVGVPTITNSLKANSRLTLTDFNEFPALTDLLLLQLEIPYETVQRALELARGHNVPVILNAAPVKEPIPEKFYQVDHFILNEQQTNALRNLDKDTPRKVDDFYEDCRLYHEKGARCVIITLGERGVVGSEQERERSNREIQFRSGALMGPWKKRDSTGASDAFIGAYAVEILRQKKTGSPEDIRAAAEMGIKAGGLSISLIGSMKSIPWREEVLTSDYDWVPEFGGPERTVYRDEPSS